MAAVERWRRLLTLLIVAIAIGLLVAVQSVYFQRGFIPGDAFNYLAAGERLNAGHPLYALSAGDRPADIHPPYWTVPFVSPPPMAVLFRLFALLPGDLGAYAWWGCQLSALTAAIVLLMRRRPLLTAAAMIVLLVPLVYEIGVGNVNSFLLLGLILTWRAFANGANATAGGLVGAMTPAKLTPAAAGWWLIVHGRWSAVGAAIVAALVVGAISLVGAGVDNHVRYLEILLGGGFSPSPLSLGGVAELLGAPATIARLVPFVAIAIGLFAVWGLRRNPGPSFAAAVVTMIAGSPAVSVNWYVLLLALLAPAAWPLAAADVTAEVDQARTKIAPSPSV
jgi:hypothetical protein